MERYDPTKHDVRTEHLWKGKLPEWNWRDRGIPRSVRPYSFGFRIFGQRDRGKGIEVGATIDAYARKVPIMYEVEGVKNKQFFFEFYVALQLERSSLNEPDKR